MLGRKGEDLAVEAFREAGLRVLERNWRCRAGEIDLIAEDGRGTTLVVCEVKTRRGEGFGRPAEAVTVRKQARLRLLASVFLSTQSRYWETVRFDVVAVSFGPEGLRVDHRPGAFV
ncbi:MAG: YraN family protein [Actinomycetota bacterium]